MVFPASVRAAAVGTSPRTGTRVRHSTRRARGHVAAGHGFWAKGARQADADGALGARDRGGLLTGRGAKSQDLKWPKRPKRTFIMLPYVVAAVGAVKTTPALCNGTDTAACPFYWHPPRHAARSG